MSYADFESNLVPQNNGKQNPDEPYINKYQNHVGCSFGYKLACVDDHFSQPVKSYLGQDAVHMFITNLVEESKYCNQVIKRHFNKELVMTKKIMTILGALQNAGWEIKLLLKMMLK